MAVEVADEVRLSTVPGIDGLIWVANNAKVGPVPTPGFEKFVLERVDVLKFVDKEVPVFPSPGIGVLGVGGEVSKRKFE